MDLIVGMCIGMTHPRVIPKELANGKADLEKIKMKPEKSIKSLGQIVVSWPLCWHVQPAVNRQPGYRRGDSDTCSCRENIRFLKKSRNDRQSEPKNQTLPPDGLHDKC